MLLESLLLGSFCLSPLSNLLFLAVGQELEEFKRAAFSWQQEAERRIREGQRRVESAEAREAQTEAAASVERVNAGELEDLLAARDATIHELQRLRVVVREVAQAFLRQRNRARSLVRQSSFSEAPLYFSGREVEVGGVGRAEGVVASILNLQPGELSELLGASEYDPASEEETRTFHHELTQILDAPLDEEKLKAMLIGLAEERANLEGMSRRKGLDDRRPGSGSLTRRSR